MIYLLGLKKLDRFGGRIYFFYSVIIVKLLKIGF
jgi:hypothetical protein